MYLFQIVSTISEINYGTNKRNDMVSFSQFSWVVKFIVFDTGVIVWINITSIHLILVLSSSEQHSILMLNYIQIEHGL